MRRTATGLVVTAGLIGGGAATAEAHVLSQRGATALAKKLEAKQRKIRPFVKHQTLSKGRRVSNHRIVFRYTDSNRADTFGCKADLVVKFKFSNRARRAAVAFFKHVHCGVPD